MTPPVELLRRIEAIVSSFEPLTREVFLAHRLDALPYDRIAQALNISIAEVESRIADAIYMIARRLDEMEAKPPE
jgi:RNA polymerase sigma-70 factor (ECF subfamily)